MNISFVIPAHDEESLIVRTIDALHAAARDCGREYEIIVADDASADATGRIARERGCAVVRHERRQIAATRNLGARAARGEYLIFVDADTVIPSETLREAVAALDGGAVAGGAPISFDGPVPWFPRLVVWVFNFVFKRRGFTGGAFFFCRRTDFVAAGGWDERFYAGEELELAREMKKRGRFAFVRTPMVTSGRKARTYGTWEMFKLMLIAGFFPRTRQDRSKMGFWYEPRRVDPGATKREG
jgi:glycosyltransferase involved in cell wall biosynthesis